MSSKIGKITSWNDEKGFGFITPKSGGKSVFFHISGCSKKHKRPFIGLSVTYNLSKDSKGRICATNVSPEKGHKEVTKSDRQKKSLFFLSSVFLGIVMVLVLWNKIPIIILLVYLVTSVLTFALYAKDKSAAQSGEWRIPEKTLHFFSIIGGWPGAAIAQSQLRHKSKKFSFRLVYWFTVIINCAFLGWLLTPEGANSLELILSNIKLG